MRAYSSSRAERTLPPQGVITPPTHPTQFKSMNPSDFTPADTIEKRRKQIEKAKAAHLSRQLQTRLQYARLKVDHGWQKQTLNEVENLYFHHYRARISSRGLQKSEKSVASTSKEGSSTHPLGSTSTATSAPVVGIHHTDQHQNTQPQNSSQDSASPTTAVEESSAMEVDPPFNQDAPPNPAMTKKTTSSVHFTQPNPHDPASPMMNPSNPQPPTVSQPPSPTKPPPPSLHPSPNPPTRNSSHAPISKLRPLAPAVTFTPLPSGNIPLSTNPSLSQTATSSLRSTGGAPAIRASHSAPSSLLGGSNAALTYDSFWSSHTTSSNYRASLTSTTSYPNLNKADAGLALPNLSTNYAPYQTLPLQKQPTLARKPSVPAPLRQSFTGSG